MEVAIVAGSLVLLSYLLLVLPTQWVRIHRVKYPIGAGLRFVQLSDLHVERLRVSPRRLRLLLQPLQPDVIVLTGDYTQYSRCLGKAEQYLQAISGLGAPVYAVLGNHDYRLGPDLRSLLSRMEKHGITVLTNASVLVADRCRLVGIDDLDTGRPDVERAFARVDAKDTVVVITHNPNMTIKLQGYAYDYLMCGHFHGMQIKVPFRFLFRKKGELMRRGIYEGLHRDSDGVFYISRGLGQAGVNVRFGVRSEVTVHEL